MSSLNEISLEIRKNKTCSNISNIKSRINLLLTSPSCLELIADNGINKALESIKCEGVPEDTEEDRLRLYINIIRLEKEQAELKIIELQLAILKMS